MKKPRFHYGTVRTLSYLVFTVLIILAGMDLAYMEYLGTEYTLPPGFEKVSGVFTGVYQLLGVAPVWYFRVPIGLVAAFVLTLIICALLQRVICWCNPLEKKLVFGDPQLSLGKQLAPHYNLGVPEKLDMFLGMTCPALIVLGLLAGFLYPSFFDGNIASMTISGFYSLLGGAFIGWSAFAGLLLWLSNIVEKWCEKIYFSGTVALLKKKHLEGDVDALKAIGGFYWIPLKKRNKIYLQAGKNGSAVAQFWLYEYNCYKDKAQAKKWLELAAAQEHTEAMYTLAKELETGYTKEYKKDLPRAVALFEKAAQQGHLESEYRAALCYYYGSGVKQDKAEGCRRIVEAAKKGSEAARREVVATLCFYEGEYLNANVDKETLEQWRAVVDREKSHLDVSWYIKLQKEHEEYKKRLHAWATGEDGSDVPNYDVSDM